MRAADGEPKSPSAGHSSPSPPACVVAVSVTLGWLPVLGLVRILARRGQTRAVRRARGRPRPTSFGDAVEPPVPQVIANSLMLGLEVGLGVLILAWLLRPDPGRRHIADARLAPRRTIRPDAPPGAGRGPRSRRSPGGRAPPVVEGPAGPDGPAARIADLAPELAVRRNPWPILTAAVGLSVGSRLLQSWRRAAERRPEESRSGLDAALLAGLVAAAGRGPWPHVRPARWIGALAPGRAARRGQPGPRPALHPLDGRSDRRAGDAGPRRCPGRRPASRPQPWPSWRSPATSPGSVPRASLRRRRRSGTATRHEPLKGWRRGSQDADGAASMARGPAWPASSPPPCPSPPGHRPPARGPAHCPSAPPAPAASRGTRPRRRASSSSCRRSARRTARSPGSRGQPPPSRRPAPSRAACTAVSIASATDFRGSASDAPATLLLGHVRHLSIRIAKSRSRQHSCGLILACLQ